MAMSRAIRRYSWGIAITMTGYVLILFGVNAFFANSAPTGVSAYAAAVLPALPIIAVFALIGRYLVEEQDEYVRMLMVRQSLIATAFALSVATVWGFLEDFELVQHVPAYWAAILWFGGLGLGGCINKLVPPGGRA
jgi:hypothetical protein